MSSQFLIKISEAIDFINSSYIPYAVFNAANSPVAVNKAFSEIAVLHGTLEQSLTEENQKLLMKSWKTLSDTTLEFGATKPHKYLLDIRRFCDERKFNFYIASLRRDEHSMKKQHEHILALLESNLQQSADIIQNIAMESNCGGTGNESSDGLVSVLREINKESYKLMKYHTDLRLINNIMHDMFPLKIERLDLVPLIKKFIALNKTEFGRTKFKLEYIDSDTTIYCDRQLFTRALTNIFANIFLLCNGKSTEVGVKLRTDNLHLTEIKINCKALKLSEKDITMLMTGDFTSKRRKATYDGLYLSNSIIIQHDGIFRINSDAENGTTVTILFYQYSNELKFRSDNCPDDNTILRDIMLSELSFT